MGRGGKRDNAGRKKETDRKTVKTPRNIKLPEWMWNWMDKQEESRAVLIEKAMQNFYGISHEKKEK